VFRILTVNVNVAVALLLLVSVQPAVSAHQRNAARAATGGQPISGRVTNIAGQGVAGVYVTILRDQEGRRGPPRLRPVDVRLYSITNERGEFVLENLSPDSYCLVAFPHNAPATAQGRPNRDGYAITYYPNATRVAEAKSVMVTPLAGATANLILAPAHLSIVSGSVYDSTGKPAAEARLLIAHGDGLFGLAGGSTIIRPDGTFALAGMPPGTYFLHMREGVWPPPRDVIPKISVAKVTVVNDDVSAVRVAPLPMVLASGRIVVAAADRASLQPSTLHVSAAPIDFDGNPGPDRGGVLLDDLTFELRTWPGPHYIRVLPESQWTVTRVRVNGVDVTNTGIDFQAGREVTGLEIELIKGPPRQTPQSPIARDR